ncbi:MAG: transposase [Nannocystaceae bacterium]
MKVGLLSAATTHSGNHAQHERCGGIVRRERGRYDHRVMAMGSKDDEQEDLFVTHAGLRKGGGHPFYEALEKVLKAEKFDTFVEDLCRPFYAKKGRPSIPPGVYFRCLLIGFFEGIDSERGIAWRTADSVSLRLFLGLPLSKNPPDHSTLSRTRRLLDLETHHRVFSWVLGVLAKVGLVKGKTVGVDSTTLEANAAMRSIVRRDSRQAYEDYLVELAKKSGIDTPTREDIAKIDRKRPKKGSNKEWVHPLEPDADIAKMKDGRTHLAHKQENAVDMDTGAVLSVTLHGGTEHDTKTVEDTIVEADNNLADVHDAADDKTSKRVSTRVQEVVLDKGYHSNEALLALEESEIRAYVAEPKRGRRNWKNKPAEKRAVYNNRRRMKSRRAKGLMRRRGEQLERPFAHMLETGGMRRTHLRRHNNILKRLLVHAAGVNLGLLMRTIFGVGTPRSLQGRNDLASALLRALLAAIAALAALWQWQRRHLDRLGRIGDDLATNSLARTAAARATTSRGSAAFTTGC